MIVISPESIPLSERRTLCSTLLDAAKRYYQNPENLAAFEVWKAEKLERECKQAPSTRGVRRGGDSSVV